MLAEKVVKFMVIWERDDRIFHSRGRPVRLYENYNLGAKVEEKLQNLTKKYFEREENVRKYQVDWFTIIRKLVTRSNGYILGGIMLTGVTKIPISSGGKGYKYAEYGKRLT